MKKIDINKLSLQDKITILSGTEYMKTRAIERLEIESAINSDGPHGIRKTSVTDVGIAYGKKATSFPTACTVASSFNPNNSFLLGKALGEEAKALGVDIILGPGMNIKKNPLCGRNFEYYSEDPYLSGKIACGEVRGIHSVNSNCCIKHFAVNSNENYRLMGDSVVDERALREIYLKSFEMVIKQEKPSAIMCAYNQVNGTFCSENKHLLTEILRDEWKYDGLVMSDWGATKDRVLALKAGLDLDMPGDQPYFKYQLDKAVENKKLDESYIETSSKRVLDFVYRTHKDKSERYAFDVETHHELAGDIATDSAVLLKNDNDFYPLKEEDVLFIGEMANNMRYQGVGSSQINPSKLTEPLQVFDEYGYKYSFCQGYSLEDNKIDDRLLEEAINEAKKHEKIIIFVGLDETCDIEGMDRKNLYLPTNQIRLIESLTSLGKKVGLVMFGGSSFLIPSIEKIDGILMMYLPGQNGGKAVASLVLGKNNPSGRLAETWILSYDDVPFGREYDTLQTLYKESVFVGYRYHTSFNKKVLFPFGYGLSYTKFEKKIVEINEEDNNVVITCSVKNIGNREGGDVVQIYVNPPINNIFRPIRELKGFIKVYLKPGEEQKVMIAINKDNLRYYDVKQNKYILDGGTYTFELCEDSYTVIDERDLKFDLPVNESPYSNEIDEQFKALDYLEFDEATFEDLFGRPLPKVPSNKPFTMETRILEFKKTFWGRIVYKIIFKVLKGGIKKAKKIKDEEERKLEVKSAKFNLMVFHFNSMRAITCMMPNQFTYSFCKGIVTIANGHLFKGIKMLLSKSPIPFDELNKL